VVDFDVFSTDSQRCHRGRIERIPLHELSSPACESSDRLVIGSHRLWVDDCQIPEYTAGNASATQYSAADYFQVLHHDGTDGQATCTYNHVSSLSLVRLQGSMYIACFVCPVMFRWRPICLRQAGYYWPT